MQQYELYSLPAVSHSIYCGLWTSINLTPFISTIILKGWQYARKLLWKNCTTFMHERVKFQAWLLLLEGKDGTLAWAVRRVWGGFVCWITAYPQVSWGQLLWQAGRRLCNYQWEEPDSSNWLNICLLHTLIHPPHSSMSFFPVWLDPHLLHLSIKSLLWAVIIIPTAPTYSFH